MRSGASNMARQLFRDYATNPDEFWSGVQSVQAEKLRKMVKNASSNYARAPEQVISSIVEFADERAGKRPPPIYVTGLGGSGSNWLAGMLADLENHAYAGEVYFPPRLLEHFDELTSADQSYVIDCIHLLHAWPRTADAPGAAIVNSASRAYDIPRYKLWDPECTVIYLVRDPRDQVLSVTFRKPRYRQAHAPGLSDKEYLVSRCESNRGNFVKFESSAEKPDLQCRYEDLRTETLDVMQNILAHLKVCMTPDAIRDLLFKHDADNMRSGLVSVRGNLDEGGKASGWQADATTEHKRIMHAELVDAIAGLGYEPDECLGYPIISAQLPAARTINFPAEHAIGEVFTRDSLHNGGRWKSAGAAQGAMYVPEHTEVRLRMSNHFPLDLLRSANLQEGDIQSLCLAGNSRVTDKALSNIRFAGGIVELDLARTRVSDAGLEQLMGFESLRGVNVWKTQISSMGRNKLNLLLPQAVVFGDE